MSAVTYGASPSGPLIPASWGEIIDKMTILELKRERIVGEPAQANICHEIEHLRAALKPLGAYGDRLATLVRDLREVNATLWAVEDAIRLKERDKCFDASFVALARSVYRHNDRRALLKREINRLTGSALVEEKSYTAYD